MEALPNILNSMTTELAAMRLELEAMRLTMVAIAALVAAHFVFGLLMLHRQGKTLRGVSDRLAETAQQVALTESYAARISAALENVTRLVVHAGRRTDRPRE